MRALHSGHEMAGYFTVVTEARIRQRRLPVPAPGS